MGEWPKKLTEEEKQFMRANAGKLSPSEIAQHLARAEVTVKKFLQKEGLMRGPKKRKAAVEIEPDMGSVVCICHQALKPLAPEERKRAITALRAMFGLLVIEPSSKPAA